MCLYVILNEMFVGLQHKVYTFRHAHSICYTHLILYNNQPTITRHTPSTYIIHLMFETQKLLQKTC